MANTYVIFLTLYLSFDLVTMVPLIPHENARTLFRMKKTQLRQDWCKTRTLKQVVESDGCRPQQVHNNYCVGQCNSFHIPLSGERTTAFQSCAVCTPVLAYYKVVTLKCPRKTVKYKRKRIEYIKKCRCKAAQLKALNT